MEADADVIKTRPLYHPLIISKKEEAEEIFVDEDLEKNELEKTVTFEYSLLETDDAAAAEDHCMKVVSPYMACAIIGTVGLFAGAYGIIVLLDTKLSTPLDMLLAFVCAISGLICFCVMRYCSLRARKMGLRRTKRRHSIKMHRIAPAKPGNHMKHDASLDSLSRLIQKNAPTNKDFF
jgi:hypothetical protein